MRHIKEITIDKFRGIEGLALKDLGDINLIVGDNNVGKTSILEAVQLFETPWSIESIMWNARNRISGYQRPQGTAFESFLSFFPYGGQDKQISLSLRTDHETVSLEIEGQLEKRIVQEVKLMNHEEKEIHYKNGHLTEYDQFVEHEDECFVGSLFFNGEETSLEIRAHGGIGIPMGEQNELIHIKFISSMAHMTQRNMTKTVVEHRNEIVELLKLFDENITGFELVQDETRSLPTEMIHHKSLGMVPLYTFGDGLKRVLKLASGVVQAQDGVILIDEIETSIHVSILPEVFRWFAGACKKYHVQVIATTHSLEALAMMAKAMVEDQAQELVVYKIEKYHNEFYGMRYSEAQMDEIVNRQGLDVR